MNIRIVQKFTVLAVVAALMSACTPQAQFLTKSTPPPTLQPTPTSTPAAGGLCANPLAPVKVGAAWKYASASQAASASTFTVTITDVRPDGFTVTTSFEDGSSVGQDWDCKPEGLMARSLGSGQPMGFSMPGVEAKLSTSNPTGATLPANVQPGMKWPYSIDVTGSLSQGTLSADLKGGVTTEFQAVGMEQVTVPAGTFDAMKVQGVSTFKVSINYGGLALPITSVVNSTFWFAPGVGWVKSTESGELVGTAFKETTELQSYNIP